MKLTLYLLFGSAFILVGIFVLYFAAGAASFSLLALSEATFAPATQRWVFLLLYVGFGILAGIWPLHTWSPDGHASAPTAVSMLHAGVLMKLGAYGVVRVAMTLLPEAAQAWAPLVGTVAVVNIVYGAFSAMAQTDLKYVVAYSSVSHMGLVMLGAATLTEAGLNGSVFQMFAHGIMTGLFFALVGLIYEKSHTREIGRMGGFGRRMPGIAACFTLGGLSSLGLPGLAGFVAEILTFLGAWQSAFRWWLFPAALGTLLTAIYVLRVAKRIFWGPLAPGAHGEWAALPDAEGPEWVSLVFLAAILILFGLVPGLALSRIDPATVALLDRIGALP
jgi:NADH-quinone oxidoreductase subunit M